MSYFDRKTWIRMESPVLAVRVLGVLQWQRSTQKYTRALNLLRRRAPKALAEASSVSLTDAIVLGIREVDASVVVELHGSNRVPEGRHAEGGRIQLVFLGARVLNRPPRGSWILQEEWSLQQKSRGALKSGVMRKPTSNAGLSLSDSAFVRDHSKRPDTLFRFTALCTRGLLCIDCADAKLVVEDCMPQSGVRLRTPFGGAAVDLRLAHADTEGRGASGSGPSTRAAS